MIPEEYKINDTRTTSDFNKQSFSGYAIKDVVSVLNKSLMSCKIEESVNWAVEFYYLDKAREFGKRYLVFL